MFSFLKKLILCWLLLLGGSAVSGQGPNQLFAPFRQNGPASRPALSGPSLATPADEYDDGIVDLEVRDNLVYCGMGDGLMILDISDPSAPTFVSRLRFPDEFVGDIKLQGQFVYLATIETTTPSSVGTFRIIDISVPSVPAALGSYTIASSVSGLDIADSLGLVTMVESIGGFDAMFILNIADPDNIVLLDSVATDNWPYRVRVRGDYAYVTGSYLDVIDISDPANATVVSQYAPDIDYLPWDVDFGEDDSLLYVADLSSIWPAYWSAFSIYNVADPANPSLWGRFPLVAYVADVKIKGDFAFVSQGSCGLEVFDITDPTSPDSVGRYQAPSDWVNSVQSFAGRIAIDGNLLFLADIGPYMIDAEGNICYPSVPGPGDPNPGDLIILDISDPTQPTLVGHYTPTSIPTDVDDEDPAVLPTSFALHQNYPNPFNPTTVVPFDLPHRSEVVLTVYNLLGQEVYRTEETLPVGSHSIEVNMGGLSSGVYLYKLQAGDFSETKKMLLLK